MRIITRSIVVLVLGLFIYSPLASAEGSGLAALKKVMGTQKVKIEHKVGLAEGTANIPPQKKESWKFMAGVNPIVRYRRYLNQPPQFSGKYPSLANHDMGIGFDGGSFGNWYRNNAIRVFINGKDIFKERAATRMESKEGKNGYLRFIWKLEKTRSLILNITVPADGQAIYAEIELALPGLMVDSIQVRLNCYPGGYAPFYKLPSHRWVVTAKNEAEVPKDFVKTSENNLFYADKLQSKGSLGLLVLPEEKPSGEIRMSNYGQATILNYPVEIRKIHLGFYAFGLSNEAAKKLFLSSLTRELNTLRNIPFWPGGKE